MDRRRFVTGATVSVLGGARAGAQALALPVPAGNQIGFKVFRNGGAIGEHHLSFNQTGDALDVTINVALLVTLAMIPVFRYQATGTERWRGGVFQSLDSVVNFNGDALQVHAEKTAAGYHVQGVNHDDPAKNMDYMAPPDTLPLTYWNKQMLSGTILNPQTAHSYKCKVQTPGWNKLPTASGGSLVAQRYDVSGKLTLSVWYDHNNSWFGLEFQKSGDITYQKVTA